MEIKSLQHTGFDAVFTAFSQAFADYELQLDRCRLAAMLKRRGFDPALSFAAFEGDEIAAFTLNGTGKFTGVPTAYDTGTGTLPRYRGQGLATGIFEYSIPFLKEAGVQQYLLEVLQHNEKAVSVYRKLGFDTIREFNYFNAATDVISSDQPSVDYRTERIDILQHSSVRDFWDFHPSWQNSFESIARSPLDFVSLGVLDGGTLAGYCVFEPASGDITQLAVRKNYRRQGVASLLLGEMLALNKSDTVKVINTDTTCAPVTEFLLSKNIGLKGRQFEMVKKL